MAEEEGLDVVDVGAMDGVRQHMYVRFEQDLPGESHFWEEWRRPQMSDDLQQRLEGILGDGQATITVGTDVKTSADFGNAAGCSVYVKLTCDQSEEAITEAHSIAEELALKYTDEGHAKACKVLNAARGLPDPGSEESRAGAPAKAKKKVTPSKKPSSPTKGPAPKVKKKPTAGPAAKKKVTGTKKPNLRRS